MKYVDGSVYQGEFKDGMRHGKGKLTKMDGEVYEGDWVDGKKHGKGVLTSGTFVNEFQMIVIIKGTLWMIVYQVEENSLYKQEPTPVNFFRTACTATADSNTQPAPSTKETSAKTTVQALAPANSKTVTTTMAHTTKT